PPAGRPSGPAERSRRPGAGAARALVVVRRLRHNIVHALRTGDAPDGPHKTVTASRTLAFYKPYGVLSCFTDPAGRPTLAGYIPVPEVYPAGRLDYDTEGLLLLTSDGALAHHITDPRHLLPKVYLAQVERVPEEKTLDRLRRGILLGGRRTRPAEVELLPVPPDLPPRPVPIRFRKSVPTAWLKVTLREGQKRQIRR